MKFEPELKLYSEVKQVFKKERLCIQFLKQMINDTATADDFTYNNRWQLFDYALDDELLFDYTDVEELQDYAYRYVQHKLNEKPNE